MPELILHIGTHKTGTTSIQHFCTDNRKALRARGLWYPSPDLGSFPKHYAHHRIAHAIAGVDSNFSIDDSRRFFDRVRRRARHAERILVSAEPFYRHALNPDGPVDRQDPAQLHRFVEAVGTCLGGFDVKVLVALRRQDRFAESLYAEQILASGYTASIEKFVSARSALLDYRQRLDDWASVFGESNMIVATFEPTRRDQPVEYEFLELVGVNDTNGLDVAPPRNVTPRRALVEFKRLINVNGQPTATNRALRQWIEQAATDPTVTTPDIGERYMSPRSRIDLLDRSLDDNEHIAERFLERRQLFEGSAIEEIRRTTQARDLTDAEFRQLSQAMWQLVARGATSDV